MKRSIEKNITKKIQTRLGKVLLEYGYKHTKPSLFVKNNGRWYQAVHIHKFSFTPSFRVHIVLRYSHDQFKEIALNGPTSDTYKEYKTNFSDDSESITKCVAEIKRFIVDIGFQWFKKTLSLDKENIFKKLNIQVSNAEVNSKQTQKLLGLKTLEK